ncbi:hypothetical protein D3C87_1721380 [compost metagenome]
MGPVPVVIQWREMAVDQINSAGDGIPQVRMGKIHPRVNHADPDFAARSRFPGQRSLDMADAPGNKGFVSGEAGLAADFSGGEPCGLFLD